MTQVTITNQPISATVSGETVVARVPAAASAAATVTGGVGPQGEAGPQGPPGSALAQAGDTAIENVADGDVLRYSANRWRNYPEANLVDGGNFVIAVIGLLGAALSS